LEGEPQQHQQQHRAADDGRPIHVEAAAAEAADGESGGCMLSYE
jgi:hypothetical protein